MNILKEYYTIPQPLNGITLIDYQLSMVKFLNDLKKNLLILLGKGVGKKYISIGYVADKCPVLIITNTPNAWQKIINITNIKATTCFLENIPNYNYIIIDKPKNYIFIKDKKNLVLSNDQVKMRLIYNNKSSEVLFSYNVFSNISIYQSKKNIKCCKISMLDCLIINIKYEELEETTEKIWKEMYGEFCDYIEDKLFIEPRKREKPEKEVDHLFLDLGEICLLNIAKYSKLENNFNIKINTPTNLSAKERLEAQYLEFRKMQSSLYESCVVCYDYIENPIITKCCKKQICVSCFIKVYNCPYCRSFDITYSTLYISKKYEDYVDLINFAKNAVNDIEILEYFKNTLTDYLIITKDTEISSYNIQIINLIFYKCENLYMLSHFNKIEHLWII